MEMAASQEIRNRPSGNPSSPPPAETERLLTTPKAGEDFHLLIPFGFPPGPEAAAIRIVQNVAYFRLLYTLVLWSGLSISLIPKRKHSLLLLIATSAVTCTFLLLLRLLPSSSMLGRVDRRLVVVLLVVVAGSQLVMTRAGIHLLLTLAIGIPVVLVHALIRTRDDLIWNEEAYNPGELFFLVGKKPIEERAYVPSSTEDQV